MILLDKPFVSDFFKQTILTHKLPVVQTAIAEDILAEYSDINFISETNAIELIKKYPETRVYTNSENAIGWVENHLPFSVLPHRLKLFKDKVAFRDLIAPLFPNYFYKKIAINLLDSFNPNSISYPFIIKPTVGFASIGVYKINSLEDWQNTLPYLYKDLETTKNLYPKEVIDHTDFIIEECIDGKEYAIDCYFDAQGDVVILNIMHHLFGSEKDVSDRIYITSKAIIEELLTPMETFLKKMGVLASLKNFVLHIEVRVTPNGEIIPIEVNPMRFGGWCTTADTAYHAYGINLYEYYLHNKRPDWDALLANKEDLIYSLIVLDNNSGISGNKIVSFDYKALASDFHKPLEIRKVNYSKFPLFGFLFTETPQDNMEELTSILTSDLRKYIQIN